MCVDPVTMMLIGTALSGGGTFMESQEYNKNQQRAVNAKNRAFAEGMTRRRQYADETGQAFNTNVEQQGAEQLGQQQQQESDRMQQAFNTIRSQPPDYSASIPSSAPKNVVIAGQRAQDKAGEKTDRDVMGLSNLSAYGRGMFNQGMDQSKFARMFGNVADNAGYDINTLLPMEMRAAETNSQKAPGMLSQLMKYGGTGMSMYGAMGNPLSSTNLSSTKLTPSEIAEIEKSTSGPFSAYQGLGGWY